MHNHVPVFTAHVVLKQKVARRLLPRQLNELEVHIDRFVVAVDGRGSIVGCGELAPLSHAVAEVRSLVVTESHYLVGDTSTARWYNAVQMDDAGALRSGFGDGLVDNSDVNNAFAAAVGIRVPYAGIVQHIGCVR